MAIGDLAGFICFFFLLLQTKRGIILDFNGRRLSDPAKRLVQVQNCSVPEEDLCGQNTVLLQYHCAT